MSKLTKLLLVFAVAVVVPRPVANAQTTSVEAETFSFRSGTATVFDDSSASGGKALVIWKSARAIASVSTPSTTRIDVRARGDRCYGAPKMRVTVDGNRVFTATVSQATWATYGAPISIGAGTHEIAVGFPNDYRTSSCDRNLRVDLVSFTQETKLYVEPDTSAKRQADQWRSSRPDDAAQMDKIASQPQSIWFGEWSGDIRTATGDVATAADNAREIPVLVAYNIPQRDCGGYSSGGTTPDGYRTWIRDFASGIGSRPAVVILEPDALASMSCLSSADQATRLDLLRDAVSVLKANANTRVYIDAGHSHWLSASDAASRLKDAGVAYADGFSLNVSNYNPTSDEVSYGDDISSQTSDKHFVIDTSRNGLGSNGEWCNASGRALGEKPTLTTGRSLVDAYLWIKRPGESDGTCNGGPSAGSWWADYALGLAQRAAY